MRNFLSIIVSAIVISSLCFSCNSSVNNSNNPVNRTADSTAILKVLHDAYKWHGTAGKDIIDFNIIVKDSFQVGVDTVKLIDALNLLTKTNYFSSGFLKNYERIGRTTDYKLKHDSVKYYNEINFAFQDADPWTFFQDDFGNYWDSLKISGMMMHADSASLKWTLMHPDDTDKYIVRFKREDSVWKISYLQGFDIHLLELDKH